MASDVGLEACMLVNQSLVCGLFTANMKQVCWWLRDILVGVRRLGRERCCVWVVDV